MGDTREEDVKREKSGKMLCWIGMFFIVKESLRWGKEGYIYIYYYKGVIPAASTQRYYIAGESGEDEKQENTEK